MNLKCTRVKVPHYSAHCFCRRVSPFLCVVYPVSSFLFPFSFFLSIDGSWFSGRAKCMVTWLLERSVFISVVINVISPTSWSQDPYNKHFLKDPFIKKTSEEEFWESFFSPHSICTQKRKYYEDEALIFLPFLGKRIQGAELRIVFKTLHLPSSSVHRISAFQKSSNDYSDISPCHNCAGLENAWTSLLSLSLPRPHRLRV